MSAIQQVVNNLGKPWFANHPEFAVGGHYKATFINAKGSAAYATNGDTVDSQVLGLTSGGKQLPVARIGHPAYTDSGTYLLRSKRVDQNTFKLVFIVVATGLEVANGTDLSAETFTLEGWVCQ